MMHPCCAGGEAVTWGLKLVDNAVGFWLVGNAVGFSWCPLVQHLGGQNLVFVSQVGKGSAGKGE